MILYTALMIRSRDMSRYAWAGLRRFQNVSFVEEKICDLHALAKGQRQNARKQARQIKYTLVQAEEYFEASMSVSLATKPTLLYYSIMSLALAEILLKQTGESSLDRARAEHRHHGLEFRVIDGRQGDLKASSSSLVAKPLIRTGTGERSGTFELWHRSCREAPLCGMLTTRQSGGSAHSFTAIMTAADDRLPLFPSSGMSFYECLCHIPGMMEFLESYHLTPKIVRGVLTGDRPFPYNGQSLYTLVIHPGNQHLVDSFFENIKVRVDEVDRIRLQELPQGGVVYFQFDDIQSQPAGGIHIPNASMLGKDEVRFWPTQQPLNEFGFLYVALFILGNYARYYPDRWLLDVEQYSPLASATEELIGIIEQRMALLAYGELSRIYWVPENN
jgi:hypothetical protein